MIKLDYSLLVTIFYVVVLYAFMSRFFFGPITRILHERRQLIEGRLQSSQQSVTDADKKASEYDTALKTARAETFKRQESQREKALAERTELLAHAKVEADRTVQDARVRLLSEAETARMKLNTEVTGLARELTSALLQDRS
jgi:F-type H+-transporting ATPase subunit b